MAHPPKVRNLRTARARVAAVVATTAAIAVAALTPALAAAPAPPRPARVGALIPATKGAPLPRADSSVATLNWAGYAVTPPTGQAITAVHGSFTVPTVTDAVPGFAATWAGIGGYTSSDLIQAGVGEQFAPGFGPSYYAWYESLPAPETNLTGCTGDPACTVGPGDAISVGITQVSPGQWHLTMNDVHRWSWQTTLAYTSSHSSAEWVLEAPTVAVQTVLPAIAATPFGPGDSYSLGGGAARTVAAGQPIVMQMLDVGLTAEALPSTLGGTGSSFNVCAYAPRCGAPPVTPSATPKR